MRRSATVFHQIRPPYRPARFRFQTAVDARVERSPPDGYSSFRSHQVVMAALVPTTPIMEAQCPPERGRRDNPGDDDYGDVVRVGSYSEPSPPSDRIDIN